MKKKRNMLTMAAGIIIGLVLAGPAAHAAETSLQALPSTQSVYLDGKKLELEAYSINGANYVKLRDVGEAVGFNVYWDGAVQIESGKPYTGKGPETASTVSTDDTRYIPKAGDVITCDDGTLYTITDVSRWDGNMFASGPLPELPAPTCDWSLLDQPEMPRAEATHFTSTSNGKEYLFMCNLYETRRMLYTLYNAIGNNPETWRNGAPVLTSNGEQLVKINLSIPDDMTYQMFWPWRASEIEDMFNSCPHGTYSMQAWDVYCDGVFQRTEYEIRVD